jgi:lysozyme family protein
MDNLDRWNNANFTRSSQIEKQAAQIRANQSRYEAASAKTGVPWDVIAVIHYRESSCSFVGVLHNGERIIGTGRKTTLVPKGRGPFATWEDATFDALMNCAPYAGKNTDWSLGSTLDLLEGYNGLGYRKRGLPSPYLWAGTDQYTSGKYVADGKFDPNFVDQQLGAAALLIALRGKSNTQLAQTRPIAATQSPAPKPASASAASSVAKVAVPAAVVAAGGVAAYWHQLTHWIGSFF